MWRVERIERLNGQRAGHLIEVDVEEPETQTELVDNLVVVAEFRDRIYPGLVETGRAERGGPDKPFHAVINAENYHALEMLTYTHRGKVSCIYIDPPYNTGPKTESTTTIMWRAMTTIATRSGWHLWSDD